MTYQDIQEEFAPGTAAVVAHRPKVTSRALRAHMTSSHQAVAARWADALKDKRQDWISPRNFTPATWALVGHQAEAHVPVFTNLRVL
jgi:hypothetical protein